MRDNTFNACLVIIFTLTSTYLVFQMYTFNIKQQQRLQELEEIIEALRNNYGMD